MMKIRVKVSFFNASGDLICSSISPQTVIDNGNKKIGCMEMYDCWPRKSSPSGGRKIMMISEYDLADDVVPRFEVYGADGSPRGDAQEWIVQPITSSSMILLEFNISGCGNRHEILETIGDTVWNGSNG